MRITELRCFSAAVLAAVVSIALAGPAAANGFRNGGHFGGFRPGGFFGLRHGPFFPYGRFVDRRFFFGGVALAPPAVVVAPYPYYPCYYPYPYCVPYPDAPYP